MEEVIEEEEEQVTKAEVIHISGRTGSRGQVTQVKVQFHVNNSEKKRSLLRNVMGPIQVQDHLAMLECEREARRLR